VDRNKTCMVILLGLLTLKTYADIANVRLSGIVRTQEGEYFALLELQNGEEKLFRVGGKFNDLTVEKITSNRVYISSGKGKQELTLRGDAKLRRGHQQKLFRQGNSINDPSADKITSSRSYVPSGDSKQAYGFRRDGGIAQHGADTNAEINVSPEPAMLDGYAVNKLTDSSTAGKQDLKKMGRENLNIELGIPPASKIIEVNGQPVSTVEETVQNLASAIEAGSVPIIIYKDSAPVGGRNVLHRMYLSPESMSPENTAGQ